jgi:ABC-2 type transport system ATP-binding protein
MEVVGPTLDDVFLDLTGRSLRESNETTEPSPEINEGTEHEGAAA